MKTVRQLRDWANGCIERDMASRSSSIAISTPVVYAIKSINRNRVYSIRDLGNTQWTCDCPAMQFYSNRGYCKHIKQVQNNA